MASPIDMVDVWQDYEFVVLSDRMSWVVARTVVRL